MRGAWQKLRYVHPFKKREATHLRMAWCLSKWQQWAQFIAHPHLIKAQSRNSIKTYKEENFRLRKALADYRRRGLFVLENDDSCLVQSKPESPMTDSQILSQPI